MPQRFIKKCPVCGSTKVAVSIAQGKNGRKVRIFRCLRCGYTLVQAVSPDITLFASTSQVFIPRYIYLYDPETLKHFLPRRNNKGKTQKIQAQLDKSPET